MQNPIQWLADWLEVRDIAIRAGTKKPSALYYAAVAFLMVWQYLASAAVLFILAAILGVATGKTWPITLGGILIGIVALIFGFRVNPAQGLLNAADVFNARLMKMNFKYIHPSSFTHGFLKRQGQRMWPVRVTVAASQIALLLAGAILAIFGEAM
jgi:hypothetical protein